MKDKHELENEKINKAIDSLNIGKYEPTNIEIDELMNIASKVKLAYNEDDDKKYIAQTVDKIYTTRQKKKYKYFGASALGISSVAVAMCLLWFGQMQLPEKSTPQQYSVAEIVEIKEQDVQAEPEIKTINETKVVTKKEEPKVIVKETTIDPQSEFIVASRSRIQESDKVEQKLLVKAPEKITTDINKVETPKAEESQIAMVSLTHEESEGSKPLLGEKENVLPIKKIYKIVQFEELAEGLNKLTIEINDQTITVEGKKNKEELLAEALKKYNN